MYTVPALVNLAAMIHNYTKPKQQCGLAPNSLSDVRLQKHPGGEGRVERGGSDTVYCFFLLLVFIPQRISQRAIGTSLSHGGGG